MFPEFKTYSVPEIVKRAVPDFPVVFYRSVNEIPSHQLVGLYKILGPIHRQVVGILEKEIN